VKDKVSLNIRNEFSQMAKKHENDEDQDVAYFATNFQNV
jgi:hypothetical protein